jgi:hypothetical protein
MFGSFAHDSDFSACHLDYSCPICLTRDYLHRLFAHNRPLGTSGIQQIGWAPHSCPFTNEEGVGDSRDSYAFDGNRVAKWHDGSFPYGQAWVCLCYLSREIIDSLGYIACVKIVYRPKFGLFSPYTIYQQLDFRSITNKFLNEQILETKYNPRKHINTNSFLGVWRRDRMLH